MHRAGQRCFELLALIRSRSDFPGVDHEGRQACLVLISVVTQRGALVLRTAYGCPFFHLFGKVPQAKNRLFPKNPLPLYRPLGLVQLAERFVQLGIIATVEPFMSVF